MAARQIRASLARALMFDSATSTVGGRILQLRNRISATAATLTFEHTGWRMWVHEIFGFFSISFGQRGGNMRRTLFCAQGVRNARQMAVKMLARLARADYRLHNSVRHRTL
jgi:hypothetical protein